MHFRPAAAAVEALSDTKTEQRTVSFSDCQSWYYETYPLLFTHFEEAEEVHEPSWCEAFHKTLMQSDERRPDVLDELLDDPADYCRRIRLRFKDDLPKIDRPKPSADKRKSKTCEESTAKYQIMVAHCSTEATSLFDESFDICLEREAVETHQLEESDLHMLMFLRESWPSSLDPLFVWSQRLTHRDIALTCTVQTGAADPTPSC